MRGDRPHRAPLSPVYEKVNQKKKYVKFINKINIFTINTAQNKSFAQGPQVFGDGSADQVMRSGLQHKTYEFQFSYEEEQVLIGLHSIFNALNFLNLAYQQKNRIEYSLQKTNYLVPNSNMIRIESLKSPWNRRCVDISSKKSTLITTCRRLT